MTRPYIGLFAIVFASTFTSTFACSENRDSVQPVAARGAVVGTSESIVKDATRRGSRSFSPGAFAFMSAQRDRIPLIADDYAFDGDYLSVSGVAAGSPGSSFILKGSRRDLYGWLVIPEQDLAYEYKTSPDGQMIVQQVPVTNIYPVCDPEPDPADAAEYVQAAGPSDGASPPKPDPPHVGDYDGSDTNKLQSKPGATKVLYMDISPLTLAKAELWRAWQVVAGAYSAFDVNVTTDAAVYNAADAKNRGKACSNNMEGRSSCAVNAFGTSRCCNVYNKGSGYYQGATTAHELGHLMGLAHDGSTSGGEYYGGISSLKWCPIMGNNSPKTSWGAQALFQWSKGEYSGANNKEDDIAVIAKNLPLREDDIPDSKALVFRNGTEVSALDNRGQIATNTDSDTFTFTVGASGGRAMLVIDRIEFVGGAYLDVDAQIENTGGEMLAKSNDMAARTAKFDLMLPAGSYKLVIKGGAEGTPQNGFSNYSSLGYYGISGSIMGAVGGGMGGTGGSGAGGRMGTGGNGGAGTGGRIGTGGSGGGPGSDAGVGGGTGTAGRPGTDGGVSGTGGAAGSGATDAGTTDGGTGRPDAGSGGTIVIGSGGAGGSSAGSGGAVLGTGGNRGTAGATGQGANAVSGGVGCSVGSVPHRSDAVGALWLLALVGAARRTHRRRTRR